MANQRELHRLAGELTQLQRSVKQLLRTGVGLGYSSFEDGAIQAFSSGALGGIFGTAYDGSTGAYPVSGPTPPTPDAAGITVTAVNGGLSIRWDGTFEGGTVAPMGFKHVEVHVSAQSGFSAMLFDTFKRTINSARGGEVLVPLAADVEYYVRLVVRTDAGKIGTPSRELGPFIPLKIREEDLAFDITKMQGSTIFWGDTAPTTDKIGDLWLRLPDEQANRWDGAAWTPVPDQQSVVDALKAVIGEANLATYGSSQMTTGDTLDTVASGQALGTNAFKPNSLVASDIVATGTVTAGLLEALLVLATTIVSGDPNATHVSIKPDGVYVYANDPVDGIPNEVIRMGTSTNDFFGITDANGMLILSLDETGAVNARTANFREDIVIAGSSLTDQLNTLGGYQVGSWGGTISGLEQSGNYGIRDTEYGIASFSFPVVAGRSYRVDWLLPPCYVTESVGEVWQRIVGRIGTPPTPSTNVELGVRLYNNYSGGSWKIENLPGYYEASETGTLYVTLTMKHAYPSSTSVLKIPEGAWTGGRAYDVGPTVHSAGGQVSDFGTLTGSVTPPPPPTQNYFVELAPAGHNTYRGNGTLRTDTTDVVQGPDPSGYNGDGVGHWWFSLPDIHGTITNMEFYAYANHTYYNDGGDGLLTPTISGLGDPSNYGQPRGKWNGGRWPKPGGRTVQLPSDWWPMYTNGGAYGYARADGIRMGNGDGNLRNYVRFNGADARLRIWYTQ